MGSISFLLGAGFSAPQGYPIGNTLSNLIATSKERNIFFTAEGNLYVPSNENLPAARQNYSEYDIDFRFCCDLIDFYRDQNGTFDYEEFYDFYNLQAKDDPRVIQHFQNKLSNPEEDLTQLLHSMDNIYNQLIQFYLKDVNGDGWYNNPTDVIGSWPGYTGFLQVFSEFGAENVMNVHSLNHDLFFERMGATSWFEGELCDGFEELGSPYYGYVEAHGGKYICRLKRYTGEYPKRYRLYKLHGSRDYCGFIENADSLNQRRTMLKTRYGVGFSSFFKESVSEGHLAYEECWTNYHSDFLTGTTSKIDEYGRWFYSELLDAFVTNLKQADMLVIVGYGARDTRINEIVKDSFDSASKPVVIVDPFPGAHVEELAQELGAKLVSKHLEDLELGDF